jgi:hypothetical protein
MRIPPKSAPADRDAGILRGFQRAGDDVKLQAFGPMVLELMHGAAALAESTDYRS